MDSMVIELQASFEPISCAMIVESRIAQPCRPAFNSRDGGGAELEWCRIVVAWGWLVLPRR
jgi:hypothetical protein